MALIHDADEIPTGTLSLECHNCGKIYLAADMDDAELRCEGCGASGFIPRRAAATAQRFPAPLGQSFVPVPTALLEHAGALGIGPHEVLLVIALEKHRRLMGDEVFPGRQTLARLTQMSEHQVKRSSSKLVMLGLITRRQPGNTNQLGRGANRYCLDPLWERLAALAFGAHQRPQTAPVAVHERPQPRAEDHLRALVRPFAGADDPICGAPVRHEVDAVEVEQRIEPVGATTAAPLIAEGVDEAHQRFLTWWAQHCPDVPILAAHKRFQAEAEA